MVVALTSTKPQGHRPAKTSRIELRATEDDRSSFLLDANAQQEWSGLTAARHEPLKPASLCFEVDQTAVVACYV